MTALRDLANAAGIDPEYRSWRGEPAAASEESLIAALRALAPDLGVAFEHADDAARALAELERTQRGEVVPLALVAWDGELEVPFRVPAELDGAWEVELTTESGRTLRGQGTLFELAATEHGSPGGVVHCVRRVPVRLERRSREVQDDGREREALERELGYHTLRWQCAGQRGEALVIAAPEHAWRGPGTGPRRWGVFAPVYGLANAASGQAGDLGSLGQLFEQVARRGGRHVATLPILA
ncbi:MAG: hypothetical protein ACRDMZ_08130, partial [Solirubrobacteraceae bacterium]